jgi:UDP-glucose 4-epimerase
VYGDTGGRRVAEDAPLRPLTPYATSTAGAEDLVRCQAAASGLGAVVLRVFNAAGAAGRLGEWHHPEAHLVPLALHTAAGLRARVTVHGVDHPTPDGTAVRDYVHVDDVARAALLALDATRDPGCAVYNIGTANGHSVREVLAAARTVTGHAIAEAAGPRHPGDPPTLVADPRAASRDLGWAPTFTLVDIMQTHWTWMRERLHTAQPAGQTTPVAACTTSK